MALRNRLHPGEIYGRLTVLGATKERNNSQVVYICVCSCGTFTTATANLLHNKHKQSCGCLRRDKPNGITHGLSKTREYHIWAEMKKRCTNPSQKTFSYYGGRGITSQTIVEGHLAKTKAEIGVQIISLFLTMNLIAWPNGRKLKG